MNNIRENCKCFSFFWLLLLLFILPSCDNTPKKVQGEYIYRKAGEEFFKAPKGVKKERTPFAWEEKYQCGNGHITKEFFRCKGSNYSPASPVKKGDKEIIYHDCRGGDRHSLPLREGKEFVYPCLIDLLNYIQEKTGKRVIVTSGHRCPDHNTYADPSPQNYSSKHMIGGEVDFYVEGKESSYQEIIALLQNYYKEKAPYKGKVEYENFQRFDKEKLQISTPPWFNKEIFIKLALPHEGRNFDNNHPYPYITIQVRFDRDKEEKVVFDDKAAKNFLRY